MSDSTLPKDQLINQIIHQGKAKRKAKAKDTYSESLSVNGCELRPVPGSRDENNSTNPKGRAFRSGAPVKGSPFDSLIYDGRNQRIQYPTCPCKPRQLSTLQGGVTKP